MHIVRNENMHTLKYQSMQLLKKMLSPFCGLNQEIGYVARTLGDKRLLVGSGALTGVHVLFDRPNPGRGAYHIGGTGFFPNEAMIRILGETIERGAQLMSEFLYSQQMQFKSYERMIAEEDSVLSREYLSFFSNEQLAQTFFPFNGYANDKPLSWIKMHSFAGNKATWIPAQLVLVGYNVKKSAGEPWLTSAVTTGTAAHLQYPLALRSALLELMQLDSVMGHWYSNSLAYQIVFDKRLITLNTLMQRHEPKTEHQFIFYYLPNPDLVGFTIACVYLQESGWPKVVIGLGSDFQLEDAMYKAYLETVASIGLARMLTFKGKFGMDKHENPIDVKQLYDLDRNVEYYASGANFSRIEDRFLHMPSVCASELPKDAGGDIHTQLKLLIQSFYRSNKQLYGLDLTGSDERNLGFKVVRVWSPQTLSLCLPSAPQTLHPRFQDYGGIAHADPHPYP